MGELIVTHHIYIATLMHLLLQPVVHYALLLAAGPDLGSRYRSDKVSGVIKRQSDGVSIGFPIHYP